MNWLARFRRQPIVPQLPRPEIRLSLEKEEESRKLRGELAKALNSHHRTAQALHRDLVDDVLGAFVKGR